MSKLFRAYEAFLHRYPILSQSIQTGILVTAGDAISQTVIEKRTWKTYDTKRAGQYFCVGAFYVGPALTIWYRVLQKYIGSSGKYFALKKMATDQICFAPCILTGFIVIANGLRGQSFEEIKRNYFRTFPDVLINNYKLWPAAQLINFYFVPLHYQVLYVQTISLAWNTYLCYKTKPED